MDMFLSAGMSHLRLDIVLKVLIPKRSALPRIEENYRNSIVLYENFAISAVFNKLVNSGFKKIINKLSIDLADATWHQQQGGRISTFLNFFIYRYLETFCTNIRTCHKMALFVDYNKLLLTIIIFQCKVSWVYKKTL